MALPISRAAVRYASHTRHLRRLVTPTQTRFASGSKSLTDPSSEQNQDSQLSNQEPGAAAMPEHDPDMDLHVDHGTSYAALSRRKTPLISPTVPFPLYPDESWTVASRQVTWPLLSFPARQLIYKLERSGTSTEPLAHRPRQAEVSLIGSTSPLSPLHSPDRGTAIIGA